MSTLRRRYGEHPVHALVLLVSFVPAAPALRELLDERPREVAAWLVGGALVHDGLLLPAYVVADAAVVAAWRRRPGRVAWLNFVRIPLAVSGMLLLMFSPVILGQASKYEARTGRPLDDFVGRWLLVTATLAAISALWYLVRVAVVRRTVST